MNRFASGQVNENEGKILEYAELQLEDMINTVVQEEALVQVQRMLIEKIPKVLVKLSAVIQLRQILSDGSSDLNSIFEHLLYSSVNLLMESDSKQILAIILQHKSQKQKKESDLTELEDSNAQKACMELSTEESAVEAILTELRQLKRKIKFFSTTKDMPNLIACIFVRLVALAKVAHETEPGQMQSSVLSRSIQAVAKLNSKITPEDPFKQPLASFNRLAQKPLKLKNIIKACYDNPQQKKFKDLYPDIEITTKHKYVNSTKDLMKRVASNLYHSEKRFDNDRIELLNTQWLENTNANGETVWKKHFSQKMQNSRWYGPYVHKKSDRAYIFCLSDKQEQLYQIFIKLDFNQQTISIHAVYLSSVCGAITYSNHKNKF